MDRVVAGRMERELTGKELGGWTLAECIGSGKSALVFRASKGSQTGAVKVFDRELVEKFGKKAQRERVLREKSLVGNRHRHLIEILDAGEDETLDLFFVVMALFRGRNIAQALADIPHERVHDLISQIAAAARFLETLNLAHRDIKPENIGISDDFTCATLFDLGVLRPIGFSEVTDQDGQRSFLGTLQYSPPELLHRDEQDTPEGWRAVTFYQLGGVLHDLLVRKPLFSEDLTPYGHLVDVVSHKTVLIQAPGTSAELRMLAQDCLVKDPRLRSQLVTWERFEKRPAPSSDMEARRDRIAQRRRSAATLDARLTVAPGILERRALENFRDSLERILRDACKQADLPPFIVTKDSGAARITFTFSSSRAHAVSTPFSVYAEGKIIDELGNIVQVEIAAAVADEASSLPSFALQDEMMQIFQGVRTDDELARRLSDTLLIALDSVQDLAAQGFVKREPTWLKNFGGT